MQDRIAKKKVNNLKLGQVDLKLINKFILILFIFIELAMYPTFFYEIIMKVIYRLNKVNTKFVQ